MSKAKIILNTLRFETTVSTTREYIMLIQNQRRFNRIAKLKEKKIMKMQGKLISKL